VKHGAACSRLASFRRTKEVCYGRRRNAADDSRVVLVPMNNRIASLNTAAPAMGWESDRGKWDVLHAPPRPHSVARSCRSCPHQCVGRLSSSRFQSTWTYSRLYTKVVPRAIDPRKPAPHHQPTLLPEHGRLRSVPAPDHRNLHPIAERIKDAYQQICRYMLQIIVQNRGNPST
jgi:hypothetical protein